MEKIYEIYIKTTPELLWQAITDKTLRAKYNFGLGLESDWKKGSAYHATPQGMSTPLVEGENLEVDPPKKLVQSFRALWSDSVKAEGTSRVTWEIEKVGNDSCKLVVTHDQLRDAANPELYGGWPMILSGLKTLLETGGYLTTPGSLLYAPQQA
ncbi:MAG TPA: SRPBCC family protein [Burkholderiales bacterium]|nr:SRPBCC family protein [Burkholderiales bacterium]